MSRTVSYWSVIQRAAGFAGIRPSVIPDEFAAFAGSFFNHYYRMCWQKAWWPEACKVGQRFYRQDYAGSSEAGDQVYFPASRKYYVALRNSTGEAPATGADLETNLAYWAELSKSYSPQKHVSGESVAVGDQKEDPDTGRVYQCHTAHTAGASIDLTKFGELVSFIRNIDFSQSWEAQEIADIEGVYDSDPRVHLDALEVDYILEADGILVRDHSLSSVWVRYRKPVPEFEGDDLDVSLSYVAGDVRYFSGDFYKALTTAAAGETPATHPEKWSLQEVLGVLSGSIPLFIYAEHLKSKGETGQGLSIEASANRELNREVMQVTRKQGAMKPWRVKS